MGISIFHPAYVTPNEKAREQAVEHSGMLSLTGDAKLQALITEARLRLGAAMAAITVVYRDWQYLVAADGIPVGPYSRRTSMCGHAIHDPGALFLVKDARADERFASNPAVEEHGLLFYAGAPLLGLEGHPLGVLCVIDTKPRASFSAAEAETLRRLAQETMEYVQTC